MLETKNSRVRLPRKNGKTKFDTILEAASTSSTDSYAKWDGDDTISKRLQTEWLLTIRIRSTTKILSRLIGWIPKSTA